MTQPTVLLAVFGCDSEAQAIRAALEWFGATVIKKGIGRPNDFLDVIEGKTIIAPDYVVLVGHGSDGGFCMEELGESVYLPGEPRGKITAGHISGRVGLKNTVIISTACATGRDSLAAALCVNGNSYIAPEDYPEGNSDLFFVIRFFYELMQNEKTAREAYEAARATDGETEMYRFWEGENL
ncbi:MAG: hypothetical protein J1F63_06735 [Oscillospiraceae bacterium]|nr:hypothetical protein [Oscillospiraceae bacterium]